MKSQKKPLARKVQNNPSLKNIRNYRVKRDTFKLEDSLADLNSKKADSKCIIYA